MVDDHCRFRPDGIAQFARSRGGHLHNDPRDGRAVRQAIPCSSDRAIAAARLGLVPRRAMVAALVQAVETPPTSGVRILGVPEIKRADSGSAPETR
jgi:hypothetical protein